MSLIPLSDFAQRVGGHPDVLVGLLNNLGCPLISENAVLHVDDNIAMAVLRAKGLLTDLPAARHGHAPRQIGFSQNTPAIGADAADADNESEPVRGSDASGEHRPEGRQHQRESDNRNLSPTKRRRR